MGTGTDNLSLIGPGFIGFLVMFALAVATILLVRSMTGHLRKVRYQADPGGGDASTGRGSGAGDRADGGSGGPGDGGSDGGSGAGSDGGAGD